MLGLAGRVALVTGAGQGIGEGVALAFARAGAHVAVVDVDSDSAARVAADVQSLGAEAGSTIALTYYPPSDWREHPMVRAVSLGARFLGEPFVGLMHTDEIHALLEQSGFGVDDDATNSELARRMGLVSAWPAIEERIVVATRR